MREFAFELRVCARLEAAGALVSRQLGAGVHAPGRRIMDVVAVEPGPGFEDRRAITPATIPAGAIEADVGVGRARFWKTAVPDLPSERARRLVDRAVEIGFFEEERRRGRRYIRQVARYPDWIGGLRGIENKPDLDRPGDLEAQLRQDVALGLFDEVVLATASHVTRAHRHRLPEAVGIWRVRDGGIDVLRPPERLPAAGPGTEIVDAAAGRTDVRPVGPAAKARARRRLAERAYGKGWRTYDLPACARFQLERLDGVDGLPQCSWHDRVIDPATACGSSCPGYEAAPPPAVDIDAVRDRTAPWVAEPPGRTTHQSDLGAFE